MGPSTVNSKTLAAKRYRPGHRILLVIAACCLNVNLAVATPPVSMLSSQPYDNWRSQRPLSRLPQPSMPSQELPAPTPTQQGPYWAIQDGSGETLEQTWTIALEVDQQLFANTSEVGAAHSALNAAEAQRWPLATLQGQYTLRDNEPAFHIDTPILPFSFDNPYLQTSELGFEGRVTMPIYSGGTISSNIEASAAELSARECQLEGYRQRLRMRVAQEFVAVLRSEYGVLVAESHASSLAAHSRDIQMLFHCERVPKNDLLAAQVALSNSEYEVIRAENRFDAARASLNRRLGRPLASPLKLTQPNVGSRSDSLGDLTNRALASRPELSQMTAQISALRHQAEAIVGTNRAQVNLQGAYTFRENQYQSPEGITSAGIGVSWQLYDAGRVRNQADVKVQRATALAHRRADLETRIQLEVRRAWKALEESRRRILVMRDAVGRAEENLRVTRQRYQNGMSTNTDVLNAETLRVAAHHNHDDAALDAVLMALELQRAIGDL